MNNKFEELEKKLDIATTLIQTLEIDDYEISLPSVPLTPIIQSGETIEEVSTEVFSIDTLKSDFTIIRQSILKLITTGQRILDSAAVLDPSDIKPATLTALSELQRSLGGNLQLLVSVYKEIANIEKTRAATQHKNNDVTPGLVNQGNMTTNNIVFSGDTNQLLEFLNTNKN